MGDSGRPAAGCRAAGCAAARWGELRDVGRRLRKLWRSAKLRDARGNSLVSLGRRCPFAILRIKLEQDIQINLQPECAMSSSSTSPHVAVVARLTSLPLVSSFSNHSTDAELPTMFETTALWTRPVSTAMDKQRAPSHALHTETQRKTKVARRCSCSLSQDTPSERLMSTCEPISSTMAASLSLVCDALVLSLSSFPTLNSLTADQPPPSGDWPPRQPPSSPVHLALLVHIPPDGFPAWPSRTPRFTKGTRADTIQIHESALFPWQQHAAQQQ